MYTLRGFRYLNFISDSGNPVKGNQFFVSFPEEGVTGEMTDKFFIPDGMELPPLTPGMSLDITFNRKGKPVAVKAATPAKP